MDQTGKTFRVFVSSTFSDLKEERNALQRYVFPRLTDLAKINGCRFQAIDLRWGISQEAGLDQRTMQICLNELARCQKITPRPNFIVLLGDRYGWEPLPEEIPETEFDEIKKAVDSDREATGLNALALLEKWYRLDLNEVPPVYVLQPRSGPFEDYATWGQEAERPLRRIFREAIKGLRLGEKALLKYVSSATHQEIERGAMQVEDAGNHVFGFFRRITNLDELAANLPDTAAKDFVDSDIQDRFDKTAHEKLKILKDKLSTKVGQGNVYQYNAKWTGQGVSTNHIGTLPETLEACEALLNENYSPRNMCEAVWRELAHLIKAEVEKIEAKGPLDQENEAHGEFRKDRAKVFIGREDILNEIDRYIGDNHRQPLAIHGTSGSGKSALMARAIQNYRARKKDTSTQEAVIIERFIGATPESTNIRLLLEGLCKVINRAYAQDEFEVPEEFNKLVQAFKERLTLAASEKPLLIFLDALDQLSQTESAHNLNWLPSELLPNVKIVVSTLPEPYPCLNTLKAKLPPENVRELKLLSPKHGEEVLEVWLTIAGRTLQGEQRREVLVKFSQCGLPLYLKLAFEEAKRWHSYDDVPEYEGRPGLAKDISGIIGNLFWRLSLPVNHGNLLVERSLGYLAAAKNGLTEDEMLDVLSRDEKFYTGFKDQSHHEFIEDRLPVTIWSRLYFDLEPYLTERAADGTSLLSFYHRQLGEATTEKYLSGESKQQRHRNLSQYFVGQKHWIESSDKKIPNLRKLSELPYQQASAGLSDELEVTLTTFDFLHSKLESFGPRPLIEDFDFALIPNFLPAERANILRIVQSALRLSAHVLAQDKNLLAGQLLGRLLRFDQAQIRHLIQQSHRWTEKPWIQPINDCLLSPQGGLILTINIEAFQYIASLVVTPDGSKAVMVNNRGEIIEIDLQGQFASRKSRVEPFPEDAERLTLSPDGKRLAYYAAQNGIEVWGIEERNRVFNVTTREVNPVFWFTYDSKQLVYLNDFHNIPRPLTYIMLCLQLMVVPLFYPAKFSPIKKLINFFHRDKFLFYDSESGQLLRKVKAKNLEGKNVAITPNGKFAVDFDSWDERIRIFDLETGACVKTIKDFIMTERYREPQTQIHNSFNPPKTHEYDHKIELVAVSELCTFAIIALSVVIGTNIRYRVEIWNLSQGKMIGRFEAHNGPINALVITPDGKTAITASDDKTIHVWDLITGERIYPGPVGHSEEVKAVTVTGDGRQIVSASQDGTLRTWDLASYLRKLTALEKSDTRDRYNALHGEISCITFTPDGRQVICGSNGGEIGIWDVESGRFLRKKNINEAASIKIRELLVTPDGKRLVSISSAERKPSDTLRIRNPDGTLTVPIGGDHPVKVWDLEKFNKILDLGFRSLYEPAMTPDGRWLIGIIYWQIEENPKVVEVWNLQHGTPMDDLHLRSLRGRPDLHVLTPDSRWIIQSDGLIRVWIATPDGKRSLKPLSQVLQPSQGHKKKPSDLANEKDHVARKHRLSALSPDGKVGLAKSTTNRLEAWDLEKDSLLASFELDASCSCVVLAADGQSIAVGDTLGGVCLLKLQNVVQGASFVTPWRAPDRSLAFGCPHCRNWSQVNLASLGAEQPCSNCGHPIRFNTLYIESEWRWIAQAWDHG
ncbi:MAG: DUF4062 domain-containing protein [Methanosarcinaceae archaeon]|nr:DUF4062 domain-containing protein [Methanosarcinaceae archaeon]